MPDTLYKFQYTSSPQVHCTSVGWRCIALLLLTMLLWINTFAQDKKSNSYPKLRVMSYNVENLYDTVDDPLTDDSEFLPGSEIDWTDAKYKQKISTIAGVISSAGEWGYPALIGLVEVENSDVVRDLITHPKLARQDYRQAVSLAADPRGVDVALLWHPRHFRMIEANEIPHYGSTLYYPYMRDKRTFAERKGSGRNTLWVTLQEKSTGLLFDVFVVHLPSRRGGVNSTSRKRIKVTEKINQVISSIQKKRPDARIIVMGDFNDNPSDRAVKNGFATLSIDPEEVPKHSSLYNLGSLLEQQGKGTHYYSHRMWLPDQFIVSGTLLDPDERITIMGGGMNIFAPQSMQINGRPRRSFRGSKYTGGFSDHYPIYLDLVISE